MQQIFVGIIAEGPTDYNFLEPVVTAAFIDVAFECSGQIDVEVKKIEVQKGDSFVEYVLNAAKKGWEEYGISILVVHADADSSSNHDTYTHKIAPARGTLEHQEEHSYCRNVVPLIPVQETEAWMLADKDFFRRTINTRKTDTELNIVGNPESFTDPKARIKEAIRIGRAEMPRKIRESMGISDLYAPIGQGMRLDQLETLASFKDFKGNIKASIQKLGLLP